MPVTDLCTYANVVAVMPDLGLATASDDDSATIEIIERQRIIADYDIRLDLIKKVQKILMPYQTDAYSNTPSMIVDLITDEAKIYLNNCAIYYTIRGCMQEGETRMRFRFQEAGDSVSKVLKRWDKMCEDEFESICPLLTFWQTGDKTIVTLLERLTMNQFTSKRITV